MVKINSCKYQPTKIVSSCPYCNSEFEHEAHEIHCYNSFNINCPLFGVQCGTETCSLIYALDQYHVDQLTVGEINGILEERQRKVNDLQSREDIITTVKYAVKDIYQQKKRLSKLTKKTVN